jgi:hypothetical protein
MASIRYVFQKVGAHKRFILFGCWNVIFECEADEDRPFSFVKIRFNIELMIYLINRMSEENVSFI